MIACLDHGRVDACAEALHLREGEHLVLRGAAHADADVVLDGLEDLVGPPQPAGRRRADLDVVLAHRLPDEHGVEGGHLVYLARKDRSVTIVRVYRVYILRL